MAILEDKIYQPFYISKQTILEYQNIEEQYNVFTTLKLSFMDIIQV